MWKHNDKIISTIEDLGEVTPYGFIYIITHIPTDKKYIGKKSLYHTTKTKLGKKELLSVPKIQGRPATFKQVVKGSGWEKYYGSNETILSLIKEGKQDEFTREIIYLAYSKKMLSYLEVKYQFIYGVLENQDIWLNKNINGTYFPADLID